jgi:hypothetical protein
VIDPFGLCPAFGESALVLYDLRDAEAWERAGRERQAHDIGAARHQPGARTAPPGLVVGGAASTLAADQS